MKAQHKTPAQLLIMFFAILLYLPGTFALGITDTRMTAPAVLPKTTGSVTVEGIVEFDKDIVGYQKDKLAYADVVKFGLKITNHFNALIPQPVNGNKPLFVKLYINGQLNTPSFFYSQPGEPPVKQFIGPNGSQTFYTDFLLSKKSGLIARYGKKFTVQWECLKVRSELVKVDLENRTAHVVTKNDNQIAMLIPR